MKQTFGQALRELRRSKNITQRELATKTGVDISYISKVENDRLLSPAADTIVKIAKVLEVPPYRLLALAGKVPASITNAIGSNAAAMRFAETAQSMGLSEEEWGKLVSQVKRLRRRTITDLKPGDHVCCIYQTEEEHRSLLSPFLRHGLERGEKVLYIVDAHTANGLANYLRDDGLKVEPYLASGQLGILHSDDAYMRHQDVQNRKELSL